MSAGSRPTTTIAPNGQPRPGPESDDLRSLIDNAFAEVTGWGVVGALLILLASWPVVRGLDWLVGTVLGRIPGIRVGIVRLAQRLTQFVVVVAAIDIMATPVVVYSAYSQRRSSIEIGITYRTDLERVSELLVAAMKTVDGVHQDPPPYTLPTGFADGTYLLRLRWWHDPDIAATERCLGSVIAIVKQALDDEGIPIPPPAAIFLSELPENRHLEQRNRS